MATAGVERVQSAAIVLTGGQSTRMGTDKATLIVNGTSMLDRVLDQLDQAGVTPVAVAGSDDVPDEEIGQGPMAGIVSGWRYLQTRSELQSVSFDPVLVLSCDLPRLDATVIAALISQAPKHEHGAVAHDGRRPQPLIAAYRPKALDRVDAAYKTGQRSVRRASAGWDLGVVSVPAALLADADRPQDLKGFDVQWPH